MLIENVDSYCLTSIFDFIVTFEDHVIVSNVCTEWAYWISEQFQRRFMNPSRVKYVLVSSQVESFGEAVYIHRPINFTELNLQRLLPNIKVIDVNFKLYRDIEFCQYEAIARKNVAIKGIVCDRMCYDLSMIACFPNAEMLVCTTLLHNRNHPFDISRLKQLYIRKGSLRSLSKYGHSLNNLLRLHLFQGEHFQPYSGADLTNLRILEYDTEVDSKANDNFDGFDLMDHCPSLESAYLAHLTKRVQINTSIVNSNLRDLVIQQKFTNVHGDRFPYMDILSKFPNLKHLAIRNANDVKDADVMKFVKILPKIELLDFQGSLNVTNRSVDNLSDCLNESGQSINIIIGPRLERDIDWVNLNYREKICLRFDFMSHCFPLPFDYLPILLIPEDL